MTPNPSRTKGTLLSIILLIAVSSNSQVLPNYSFVSKMPANGSTRFANIEGPDAGPAQERSDLRILRNPYDYDRRRKRTINIIGGTLFGACLTAFVIGYINVYKLNHP